MRVRTTELIILVLVMALSAGRAMTGAERKPVHIELMLLPANDLPETCEWSKTATGDVMTCRPTAAGVYVAVQGQEADGASGIGLAPGRPIAVLTDMEGLKRFVKRLPAGSTVDLNGSCILSNVDPAKDPLPTRGAIHELREYASEYGVTFTLHSGG